MIIRQAQLDDLFNSLHESIEIPGLSVAPSQRGNGGHIIAFFVAFDHHSEFARSLHGTILAKDERPRSPSSNKHQPYSPSFSKNKQIDSIPR